MLWDELVVIEELEQVEIVENLALLSRPELGVTFTEDPCLETNTLLQVCLPGFRHTSSAKRG